MAVELTPWSGVRASVDDAPPLVILGTMNFGKRTSEGEALSLLDHAFERGVTHWDTANAYVEGTGERIVGKALRGRRDRVLLATKVGLLRIGGTTSGLLQAGGEPEGLSRRRIVEACDESLKRLGTDYIDLYYLHVPDAKTPIEETLRGMSELIEQGKVRAWALSNYASWQILEMLHWVEANGAPRPLLAQQLYNVLVRQLDVEYLRFAARYQLATAAYNPLAGGLLARPLPSDEGTPATGSRFDGNAMYQRRYFTDRMRTRVAEYRDLAGDLGVPLLSLAYAWLARRAGVDSIVVGPGSIEHLNAALDGLSVTLSADALARIDALYRAQEGSDATYARP
jgi:aryl-alcohol dehydrogenase-like predicted oxidoreductase